MKFPMIHVDGRSETHFDIHDKRVKTVDFTGSVATVMELPFIPNSFGLTPQGTVVVGDAFQRRIYRQAEDGLQEAMLLT